MTTLLYDLNSYLDLLGREKELLVIDEAVDPCLEIAEIHRRVIARGGPALYFSNVKGSSFPVVTNLFGTSRRLELAFGKKPLQFVKEAVDIAENMLPPTFSKLWQKKGFFAHATKIGIKKRSKGPILDTLQKNVKLSRLPMLTSWHSDGGPFVTLPLVYTEHPDGSGSNLGMYRIQRHNDTTTGMHWQIHKGGGYHHFEAERRNIPLPVTLYIGGPPALMVSAVAPLPEDLPELIFASLLMGGKLQMTRDPLGGHDLIAHAEFAIKGEVPPHIRRPEGPFGDHYGYNSLQHDYPIFTVQRMYHRKNAVYPATVVGRPKQEDFFIGDFLQDLLSPLFPLVMKGVKQLRTYGETGFHSLAAAKVCERYPREAFAAGLRILGEGQLSLTKFLIITDGDIDVSNFPALWRHVLERIHFEKDLFIFSGISQDTLDYTGPEVNSGSKALMMGLGKEKVRDLSTHFSGHLPQGCKAPLAYLPGTLVIEGRPYNEEPEMGSRIAKAAELGDWPVILLVDNTREATCSLQEFLWTFFTRFEPAADIHAAQATCNRFHLELAHPVVFDCRMKPWYTEVLEVDEKTRKSVDARFHKIIPPQFR